MSTTTAASNAAATQGTSLNNVISGISSGINWQTLVTKLIAVERQPETTLHTQQSTYQNQNTAYQGIGAALTSLNNDITTLSNPSFFDSRQTTSSDSTVATATAAQGTSLGTYNFNITQLASNAVQQGTTATGKPLSATNNVSSLTLSSAGFVNPVIPGTFTVNGQTVTVAASDTLQNVFDNISTATGGAVTGSYNATTDEITLNSTSGNIVLGSANDTSNFLQSAKLYNNGSSAVTSTSALGGVNLTNALNSANLSTTISDGGSGAGQFTINGVQFNFNAATDSVNDVLTKINDSSAGVTASYDSINNRFELTNATTGDVGISMQDVTGNFLAATGLSGTLQRGNNLLYTINNGGQLTSQSNTITASSSGLTGLTVNALKNGIASVSVGTNTTPIATAITSFVNDYNSAQTFIAQQLATSTDANGVLTPGTLTGSYDVSEMETKLRELSDATVPGLTGVIQNLNSLGITSNGTDNTFTVPDSTTLANTLSANLGAAKTLFTDPTNGVAANLSTYMKTLLGTTGYLQTKENDLTKESSGIDTTIATMEKKITNDQTQLTNEFVAMETAEATIQAQQNYLTQAFP